MTNDEWLRFQKVERITEWLDEECMDWVPVKVNLPPDYKEVLVYTKYGDVKIATLQRFRLIQSYYMWKMDYGCLEEDDVVAWMPLPAPYRPA